jgi:putative membrane protein
MVVPLALLLHASARIELTSFTVHPSTVIGLMALGALYAWRARRGRLEGAPPLGRAKPALFATALVTMFLSLNGWLHDLSDSYLFSAHMLQHLLLALVVAPLLIMGTPGWMLRPALRVGWVRAVAKRISHPFFCYASFNIVMIAWHLPTLYNAAIANHAIHITQHLMFMVVSVLMWWPVLSPLPELPRISYPLQMLYLFLITIPMSVISIYITYADQMLYPAYASAPRIWGLSPMNDQLIGGLIMWIPGGLFFFSVISVIFFRWQQAGALDSGDSAQVGFGGVPSHP